MSKMNRDIENLKCSIYLWLDYSVMKINSVKYLYIIIKNRSQYFNNVIHIK